MRTQPWVLAAAVTAVASFASAEPETRPRIYYPRAVKRQITNNAPFSVESSADSESSTIVSQSSTRRGLLDELLSGDLLNDGKTNNVEVKPTDKTDDIDDAKDEGVIIDPSGIILPGLDDTKAKPTPISTSKDSTSTGESKESTSKSTESTSESKESTTESKESTTESKESTKTSTDETTKESTKESPQESTKTSNADESTTSKESSSDKTTSETTSSKLLDLDPILTKLIPTPTSQTSAEETTESASTETETESASTDETSSSSATASSDESSSSKLIELPTLLPEPSETTTSEATSSTTSNTTSSTDETSNTTVEPTSLPPTTTPVPPPSSTTTNDNVETSTSGSAPDISSTTANQSEPVHTPDPEPTPEPVPSSASSSESSATDAEPVTQSSTSGSDASSVSSSSSVAEAPATPISSASSTSGSEEEEKPATTSKAEPEPTTTEAVLEPTTAKASEAASTTASTTLKPVTTTKKPEQDDDDDWLPTTIVREATSADSTSTASGTGEQSTTATSLPSSMPKFILPDEADQEQPEGTVPIQVGFLKPLNFKFVAKNSVAAAQIFKYLPNALADAGSFPRDKVIVRKLVPMYAPAMNYPITIAQAWFPEDRLEALKMQLNTPNSALYHNDRTIVNALTEVIDSRIDLQGNLEMQNGNAGDDGSSSEGDNNNDAFDDNSDEDGGNKTAKDRATTAGIALGALSLAGLYGAAMFIVARRYKRKRQGHQRASSIGSSQASSEMRYNGTGSPALMGGALMGRDASNYGGVQGYGNGRDSQNSGQTGGQYSARNANISAPVATENSLGWN